MHGSKFFVFLATYIGSVLFRTSAQYMHRARITGTRQFNDIDFDTDNV